MSVLFAGMAALLLLAAPLDKARAQDAPRVSTVRLMGAPASGNTYCFAELIEVGVTFTEAVTVTGTPNSN